MDSYRLKKKFRKNSIHRKKEFCPLYMWTCRPSTPQKLFVMVLRFCGSQMNDPLPLPNAQELLNIYKIMKTLYHHGFNQNGSVATHARRDRLLTLNTNEPKSGQ